MIYLACPYTHPDADIRAFRFEKANQALLDLKQRHVRGAKVLQIS